MDAGELQVAADMARADLYFFARWMFLRRRGYRWMRSSHHRVVCDALMRVYRGECKRLIINIPPRYSKTELAVVCFIAWAMGQVPDSEFIHVSYGAPLAVNNSSNVLALMRHEGYRHVFPGVDLATDAKTHWTTTPGGVMYAAGAGGPITGFGAGKHREGFGGAIVIDDPHKADEARSDVIREGVIDWFQNTLESRKNGPDTPIILIMQRLHERDLAGWLLGGGNGEKWDHVCLPALQDDGSALWPEKHGADELRRMQEAAPYTFAGQYQQRPAPPEGGMFLPDQIKIVDAVPPGIRKARGWDLAATEEQPGKDPDYTVGAGIGRDDLGRFWIWDIRRFRGTPLQVEQALINTAAMDGQDVPIGGPQDPGQAGKAQAFSFMQKLAGYDVEFTPETGSKTTRAAPLAAQVEAGNVYMVKAPWNQALIDELRIFPNGTHDDQVDGLARAFHRLLTARRWVF